MNAYNYYEELKDLAQEKRLKYGISGARVLKTDLKLIFKKEGIRLDYWDRPFKKLRGAYFNDAQGPTIMVAKRLPLEPFIFTMAHEYKHHLKDADQKMLPCLIDPSNRQIEIGAEIFASEFIYPERLFIEHMEQRGIGQGSCNQEMLVLLKHETRTTLSYAALRKRAIWLKFALSTMPTVGWINLERHLGVGNHQFKQARLKQ